jgi:HPt (histidine-containing phosphotransfer) domain-containing protein
MPEPPSRRPTDGAHSSQEPPVRFEHLAAAADGELEFERELATLFIDDVSGHLADLDAAAQSGDTELVRLRAHSIKGASSPIGALPLSRAAEALEEAAANDRVDSLPTLAARVAHEFARARDEVRRYLDERATC